MLGNGKSVLFASFPCIDYVTNSDDEPIHDSTILVVAPPIAQSDGLMTASVIGDGAGFDMPPVLVLLRLFLFLSKSGSLRNLYLRTNSSLCLLRIMLVLVC